MDMAIVTCCHNYGRYLEAWARSLVAMTAHPALVCIVDAASTDGTPKQVTKAAKILGEAGIEVKTDRIDTANIGVARNRAVGMAEGHEWVQHFDCDDEAMPHMLDEFGKYADRADVICAGYERSGDLKAGPSNRTRLYRSTRGESTLSSTAPCSGVSPFRRKFWERSPYREDMIGGWDTALWLGFAHLNARFVATKRPVFYYRQHRDSVFNVRRKNPRTSALVGRRLESLRRGDKGVSVIVPWRSDGGHRDRAWVWVRERYARLHPDWQVVTGTCSGSVWRKGEAVNDALSRATGFTLVIADADCVVTAAALTEAVQRSENGAPWVIPHTTVRRLTEDATHTVLAGPPDQEKLAGRLDRRAYKGFAGGGMLVIERSKFEAAGGLPEVFQGWGAEDEALAVILDTLIGPHVRLDHDLWHLWHPSARRGSSGAYYDVNRQLHAAVQSRAGDPDGLWRLLDAFRNGPDAFTRRGLRDQKVRMVAVKDFPLGNRHIVRGQTFLATPEEARRFVNRKDKVAVPRASQVAEVENRLRAEAFATGSFQERRLALAGTRTRAEAETALMAFQLGARPPLAEGPDA